MNPSLVRQIPTLNYIIIENGKVELTPESGKKGTYTESNKLDEWTISRWQHYAGIK
jgi:hypothetical protein